MGHYINFNLNYDYLPIHCNFYFDMSHHIKDYLALVDAKRKARNSGHGVRKKLAIIAIGSHDGSRGGKSKDELT